MGRIAWISTSAALLAVTGVLVSGSGSVAAEAADPAPSLVEDYVHPGAGQILAEHGLKVFKGDGHIVFVTSRALGEEQCAAGQIQVEKWLEAAPYGVYYCFRTIGSQGVLTLEVPGTFLLRGGSVPIQAKADLPDGQKTYQIAPNGFVAIDPGDADQVPQAVLVELKITGA